MAIRCILNLAICIYVLLKKKKKKENCAEKAPLLAMNKVGINQEKLWTSKIHKISHGS